MAIRLRGAIVILCATLGTASADTPQEQADKLFAEGRELVNKGQAQAACDKFEAAIKLDATATGTMLNLGLCYEKLGKYATSIHWFRKAQAAAFEGKQAEYEAAAKVHTLDIASKVPFVVIDVNGPPDTEVRVDGQRIAPTDYGRLEVDPKEPHEIVARAAGKRTAKQLVALADGESKTVTLAVTQTAVPVFVDRGEKRRTIAYVLGGAGVATWCFNLVYGLHERSIFFDPSKSEAAHLAAKDHLASWGTGIFVVGAGLVGAAAILYFTAPGKEQISDGTAWVPVVSSDRVGFAVSGAF